jgi:uncharacterized membrane protein
MVIKDKSFFRHFLKTVSYRVLGTLTTFTVVFFLTGDINISGALGFSEIVLKPIIYFIHERIWFKYIKMKG